MNNVIVADAVVDVLAKLADREDQRWRVIRALIARMVTESPRDPAFPGHLGEAGPLIAVGVSGYRMEIEILSDEQAHLRPGVAPGSFYVFRLVSPGEQAMERSSVG